ncbi:MAG TPA: hypothetical protein VIR60_09625 [Gammaproteobacteria bacterium]
MMRKAGLGLLAVLVLLGIAIGAWLRSHPDDAPASATWLTVDADCDSARQTCSARAADLEIELRLGPPVRPMEAFEIRLQGSPEALADAAQITLEFQMRDMDMGLNRYRLERAADGVWRGRAILPMCVSGRSDWLAKVEIDQDGRRWTAELPFTVAPQ